MNDLIEEFEYDLDRFEPAIIDYIRNEDGEIKALPAGRPMYALHYNKDVFDTIGVDYPKDDMTWEEVVELAEQLTQERDGTQYRGLDLDVPYDAYTQFSQNSVDPDTNEVLIQESEAYRRYLEMIQNVTSIPGNYPDDDPGGVLHNWGSEFAERRVAMWTGGANFGWLADTEMNVDIATYPSWEGYEGIGPAPNANAYAITAPSEHKDAAFEVLAHLLSDEVQMEKSKEGMASPLATQKYTKPFTRTIRLSQRRTLLLCLRKPRQQDLRNHPDTVTESFGMRRLSL